MFNVIMILLNNNFLLNKKMILIELNLFIRRISIFAQNILNIKYEHECKTIINSLFNSFNFCYWL